MLRASCDPEICRSRPGMMCSISQAFALGLDYIFTL
jgi:hypothetical protein